MKNCPHCGGWVPEAAYHCDCGHRFPVNQQLPSAPPKPNATDGSLKRERVLFVIIAVYLAITFIRRLFPIDEQPSPTENLLGILFELGMAVGIIGLGARILRAIPPGTFGRGKWILLLVIGIVSLLGIFAIRLGGGQRVELAPRVTQSPRVPADPRTEALGAEVETLTARMKVLVASAEKAQADLNKTRWQQTAAEGGAKELQKLSKEDLREQRSKHLALLDSVDQILQYLAESGFEEKFDRLLALAHSNGLTATRKRSDARSWRIVRELHGAACEFNRILEENWEEWRSITSPPPRADLKPWQKEMQRLAEEMKSAEQKLEELP